MSTVIHKSPEAGRDRANAVDVALIPSYAVKQAALMAEAVRIADGDGLSNWEIDTLVESGLFTVENGLWLPSRSVIRVPPGKVTTITIKPPIKAKKLALVYLDSSTSDDVDVSIGLGSDPSLVTFTRRDGFDRPLQWASDLVTAEKSGKVVIKIVYSKVKTEVFDYFLGYGIAWS
jgi:hypothetical protein